MQARANRLFNRLSRAMEKKARVLVQIVEIGGTIDAGGGLYWGMAQLQTGTSLTRVRANRTKPYPNAWYKARHSPDDGILEIMDLDPVTAADFFAGTGLTDPAGALSVANHGWTHYDVNNLDTVWIAMQQIVWLQCRPTDPRSLSIDVTPYPPAGYAGNTAYSLASYLPNAGKVRFVIVALDMVTGALAITASTPITNPEGVDPYQGDGPVPFDLYDVDALAVDHNHIRSAAIRLFSNQTEIRWKDIFLDLRQLGDIRQGYLRLDDDDPTIEGLADKLVAGTGAALSRVTGDVLVISVPGSTTSGWDVDAEPTTPGAPDDEFNDSSVNVKWTEYDTDALQTVAEDTTQISLSQPTQTSAILTGEYQAIPSGDFTLAAKVRMSYATGVSPAHFGGGFVLWEDASDDSKKALFCGLMVRTDPNWRGYGTVYFTAHDTLSTESTPDGAWVASTWYYLRLRRDGTSYYLDFSTDGESWASQDITPDVTFTPTDFGLGLYNQASAVTLTMDADFFRYRNVADGDGDPVYGKTVGPSFLELPDTPDTYTGNGLELVRVNAGETALEFTPPPKHQALFTFAGGALVEDDPLRIYNVMGASKTITKVFICANTAPTGADLIVDIHKNGTTIFTTQNNRPTITAGANTGTTTTIEVPTWADGEYLTAHIDQVGSTIAGSDITVHVVYE